MQLQLQNKASGVPVQIGSGEHSGQQAGAEKLYLALVRGITPECGVIDHALAKSKEHEKREARSAFQRLGVFERYSLVRVRPFSGRLHQIRRHMKFICHPLIGDTQYGKGEHNRFFREQFALQRLALHAAQLRFLHPVTSVPQLVSAPLPADLAGPFARLGLLEQARCGIETEWPRDSAGWRVLSDLTRVPKPASTMV
jgi:tRNA pseudouridine65 synthase